MKTQPSNILKLAAWTVSTCLAAMTFLGAHSLTGSWLIAIPLACIVPLQWAVAKYAMLAIEGKSFIKASAFLMAWLVMAGFTVPLTGAELYSQLGASNQANVRVNEVLTDVHASASKITTNFVALDSALQAMAAHAEEKAKQEESYGGSCGAAFGRGIGNINRFRNGEVGWASNLRTQLAAPLASVRQATENVVGLTYNAKVPIAEFQRTLTKGVSEINALKANSLWSNLSASVAERHAAGAAIEMPNGSLPVNCLDPARTQLLSQLDQAAKAIASAADISTRFNLLDPNNHKDITMAALARTWVWLTSPLPNAMQIRLSDDMAKQYGIDPKKAFELSAGSMPLALAWILEGIALLLVFFMKESSSDTAVKRLFSVALAKLQVRKPALTDWINAIQYQPQPVVVIDEDPHTPFRPSWSAKVERFIRDTFIPWNNKNYCIVTPTHMPVARALANQGLLRRIVSSIDKIEVTREPRYAAMLATNPSWAASQGPFGIYEIINPQLIEWVDAKLLA
jgi:hypothetical protein